MKRNHIPSSFLINEDLFKENIDDFANKDLEYINLPHTVGIITKYQNDNKTYIVYSNNEKGKIEISYNSTSFTKAVIFAREIYEALSFYYQSVIPIKIKKY